MQTNFPQELNRLIKEAGSIEKLAARIGRTTSTIERWKKGQHPTVIELERLEKVVEDLNVTLTFNSKS